ncbi:unnamed protein product [Protopolystoma xenopodis]|uniref:Uncharacterized protein n=1 Tax=Protopolystoma xenopodis TaxID=117903 RepID=A0A3S5A4K8_9PLAT|nr:unnamed protein product [Protopolystoma xenopodis]
MWLDPSVKVRMAASSALGRTGCGHRVYADVLARLQLLVDQPQSSDWPSDHRTYPKSPKGTIIETNRQNDFDGKKSQKARQIIKTLELLKEIGKLD